MISFRWKPSWSPSPRRQPTCLHTVAKPEKDAPVAYIMVDIEADGPIPGDYSMVCFGAIVVEPSLERTLKISFK